MKHLLTIAALVAFGFALSPSAARAQATDQPAATSPAATATVNPMESPGATATTPPDQTTTTAASSSTTSGPWGLIGLLGLLGLIGLRGRGTTTTEL